MIRFALLIILFLPLIGAADEPRWKSSFVSSNGKFELKYTESEWRLIDRTTNIELYKLNADSLNPFSNLAGLTVLVSDDGKGVVAVDDYSNQHYKVNPDVLFFYQNGEQIKSYKLGELLESTNFVSVSVSHFSWVLLPSDFGIADGKVTFETYDLNRRTFDARTGALLKSERCATLSNGSVYVYGMVKGIGGDRHEIQAECVLYGDVQGRKTIPFTSKSYRWEGSGFLESLIIRDGQLIARHQIIFNTCKSN